MDGGLGWKRMTRGFDAVDAIAGFRVDVVGGEVVGDVQGGELGARVS